MVRTHIGVKWPNIETTPLTGTIAYEVMTKRSIPGPGVYDPPVLGGPHGGKFNVSTTKRLIDQYVYDARKLPGPGQYNGTYEPIDVPLAGYTPVYMRSGTHRETRQFDHSSPNRLPLTPSLYSTFGDGRSRVRQSLPPIAKSPQTPNSVRWRGDETRSRSVEPCMPLSDIGPPGSSGRRVSFSKHRLQEEMRHFASLGLMEYVGGNNGKRRFDGGHSSPSGVTYVDHRLETPENRILGRPLGGQARKASQVSIVSTTTFWNEGGGNSLVSYPLLSGEQSHIMGATTFNADVLDPRKVALSGNNTPMTVRSGAVAFDQFSLCRTTNSDDELASVNTNDATIKGRKGDGRTEFVMSPVLRRSPKHRHA